MAAVLRIRFDNEAGSGLQELERQLQQTAAVTADAAIETRVMTDAQRDQIKVVHEHRAAFSQLAASLGHDFIRISETAVQLGIVWWQVTKNSALVRKAYGEVQERATSLASSSNVLGASLTRVLGILTRTGPVVAGVVGGAKLLESQLARTGIEIDRTSELAKLNERAFDSLRAQIVNSGQDWEAWALANRELIEDMGGSIETNLDRVGKSLSNLGENFTRPVTEAIQFTSEWAKEVTWLKDKWEELDRGLTAGTKNFKENAAAVSSGLQIGIESLLYAGGGMGPGQTRKELESFREIAAAQEKVDQAQRASAESFDNLYSANAEYQKQIERTAESERLRSLNSVAAINGEIDRQKSLAGQRAAQAKFSEEDAKAFLQTLSGLEQQRTAIVKREADKQKELRKKVLEETETREKAAIERRARDEGVAVQASVDRYNKWAEEVRNAQKRANDFAREFANNANNSILESTIERLDSQEGREEEAHRAKLDLIQQEIDQRIAAAETVEAREQAFYDGLLRMQGEQLRHQREAINAEIEARKAAAAKAVEIEKKKQDALKQALQDSGIADGQKMLQQIDPRRALMDQRGRAAADEARKAVLNDPDNQKLRQQALVDVAASRRLRAMQERAAREAEKSARAGAYRDLRRGDVDPAELAQAQANAGQQMLQTLRQNGQLSGDAVKILQENLQVAANQQGTLGELQRQLDQLQGPVKALLAGSAQQRQRATKGGLN